jgi:hypothetical protein
MDRKDFLDSMIELRNKGKNIAQTASPENGRKDSQRFSKFCEFGCDVTAAQRLFPFLYAVLFRNLLDSTTFLPCSLQYYCFQMFN